MKFFLISLLPEFFREGPAELNQAGQILVVSIWGIFFLLVGISIGGLFLRNARSSVTSLERENEKGFNRLAVYRATVEKQSESPILKN
ncbi:MAG: hypothetical protein P1U89_00830 [Verrucomicrobiales bacterium]|nr:hypothetical protein [Verrucomicrobiales bacterium]